MIRQEKKSWFVGFDTILASIFLSRMRFPPSKSRLINSKDRNPFDFLLFEPNPNV